MRLRALPLLGLRVLSSASEAAAPRASVEFARLGPLYPAIAHLALQPHEWHSHGTELVRALSRGAAPAGATPCELDGALARRVYHLYLPLYFFCRQCVRSSPSGRVPVIGLSAPQGCGKTTLVELLRERFAADGLSCAALSFDDFYLRGAEQDTLAAANQGNQLLQAVHRGSWAVGFSVGEGGLCQDGMR